MLRRAEVTEQSSSDDLSERRVVALVLPALLCELAEPRVLSHQQRHFPLAVVLGEGPAREETAEALEPGSSDEIVATSVLSAVNESAQRLGVRVGQTLTEGRALASRLVVRRVSRQAVERALGRVAEIALAFGATASFSAPDTV